MALYFRQHPRIPKTVPETVASETVCSLFVYRADFPKMVLGPKAVSGMVLDSQGSWLELQFVSVLQPQRN